MTGLTMAIGGVVGAVFALAAAVMALVVAIGLLIAVAVALADLPATVHARRDRRAHQVVVGQLHGLARLGVLPPEATYRHREGTDR